MTAPLVDRVVRAGRIALIATLAGVGLATAGAVYLQQRIALDQALLAAAHAYGTPEWQLEHARNAIEVTVLTEGDGGLPRDWLESARRTERPDWHTFNDRRVLIATIEARSDVPDEQRMHALIVASAPEITLARSVGPFATAYLLVAGASAAIATLAWRRLVTQAVAPLLTGQQAVAAVVGAGRGARVAVDGPPEVADLLKAVNELLSRLDLAFAAQSRFTAEAAHELRTPVAAMLGDIDVALRRPRSEAELRATLQGVRGDVLRLAGLVDGLLTLARVDSGHAEQGREQIRASALALAAARQEQPTIEAAGGRLAVTIGDDPDVSVHAPLLVAALANLLRNAAVHAPGADVRLSVGRQGSSARFVVEDDGPGVPEAQREAVFGRLARSPRGGLGLGLSLAREVARRHGGDCVIEATARGTRVVLTCR